jgi:hypothetical protein
MATICSSFLLDSIQFNDPFRNLKILQGRAGLHVECEDKELYTSLIVFDERGRLLTKIGEDLTTCSCLHHEEQLFPVNFNYILRNTFLLFRNYRLSIKSTVFWVKTPCSSEQARRFEGRYRFRLQCRRVSPDTEKLILKRLSGWPRTPPSTSYPCYHAWYCHNFERI